jgi:CrcB protein
VQLFPSERDGLAPAVLLVVAAGGALGAVGRWGVAELWFAQTSSPSWEWPILLVNVIGSLAIGVAARRFEPGTVGWSFTVTGVLSGFTTFSAFAVALDDLADADRLGLAIIYAAATLMAGIGATSLALAWTPASQDDPHRGGEPRNGES